MHVCVCVYRRMTVLIRDASVEGRQMASNTAFYFTYCKQIRDRDCHITVTHPSSAKVNYSIDSVI